MASPCSSFLVSLSLFAVAILAKPLQAPTHPSSALLSTSNLTTLPTRNISADENAGLLIRCNGEHFGVNPNIADCASAKEYISPDSVQYTWGQRHSGLETTVFPLPYRIMGGQLSATSFLILPSQSTKLAQQVSEHGKDSIC